MNHVCDQDTCVYFRGLPSAVIANSKYGGRGNGATGEKGTGGERGMWGVESYVHNKRLKTISHVIFFSPLKFH